MSPIIVNKQKLLTLPGGQVFFMHTKGEQLSPEREGQTIQHSEYSVFNCSTFKLSHVAPSVNAGNLHARLGTGQCAQMY